MMNEEQKRCKGTTIFETSKLFVKKLQKKSTTYLNILNKWLKNKYMKTILPTFF
nr:MAG TPA: hypothetical protein [Caudoviricetes sp.]